MKGKGKTEKSKYTKELKEHVKERIKKEGIKKISEILKEIEKQYLKEIEKFDIQDPGQSWRSFKGKFLEEIILEHIIDEIKKLGFGIVEGKKLERKSDKNLSKCLSEVKRSVVVDFGQFGMHMPDADLVIYDPDTCKAVAIISSKTTLRERIAQTGYWHIKIKSSPVTKDIKVFFITLDEDGDLTRKYPAKKGRAIAETDTDGTFVITAEQIEESDKIKTIDRFFEILNRLKTNTKR